MGKRVGFLPHVSFQVVARLMPTPHSLSPPFASLRGGPCRLADVQILRVGSKSRFWSAVLSFDNGQQYVLPLYSSCAQGPAEALASARRAGSLIAARGRYDVPELIKAGCLPLKEYLQGEVSLAAERVSPPGRSEYRVTFKRATDQVEVRLFSATGVAPQAVFAVTVPGVNDDEELRQACEQAVASALGPDARRSHLRTSPRAKSVAAAALTAPPEKVALGLSASRKEYVLRLRWPGREASFSLGTEDLTEAEGKAEFINRVISQAVAESQSVSLDDVRAAFKAKYPPVPVSPLAARKSTPPTGSFAIPIGGKCRLKCYQFLTQRRGNVPLLMTIVASPDGNSKHGLVTLVTEIAPTHGLTSPALERLRGDLRDYLVEKLTAYFAAGGRFPNPEDVEAGVKVGLTPAGMAKLEAILEHRLSSTFVNNALAAGYADPFSRQISSRDVQRLSERPYYPRPAHPDIRFGNCREEREGVALTLTWRDHEDKELLHENLTVRGLEDVEALTRAIDDWTKASLGRGEGHLPRHATMLFLREQLEKCRLLERHP